ncbi:MAG: hypothetical protein GW771_12660 [Flavobacteriia bacterium]|nr:hypothetical protein [Flavobacteriia bacterium]
MKNSLFLLSFVFFLCFGNLNAQNISKFSIANTENNFNIINYPVKPMPNWMDYWSKESVITIKYLIKKYGEPDEKSKRRMVWNLEGVENRSIIFTESISFKNSEVNYNLPNNCNLLKFTNTKSTYTGLDIASDYKNNL